MRTLVCMALSAMSVIAHAEAPQFELQRDDQAGQLRVMLDGREILAYRYGEQYALPHYWPVRSPSGKLLTEQHPDPFPHHRSVWIADKVKVGERPAVDFYHCWTNYRVDGDPTSGYRHYIRHQRFANVETTDRSATVEAQLHWVIDDAEPVIEDVRTLRVFALGDGEYLVDLAWELKALQNDVAFTSDWVHYAWPYVRIHPQFSGLQGGVICNDQGRQGEKGANAQYAKWIDYSNSIDGRAEGLAVFVYPDGQEHKWLTREYGAFGPRRPDQLSGTGFELKRGETLPGRVGILVHQGDVSTGRVAERYRQYVEGRL